MSRASLHPNFVGQDPAISVKFYEEKFSMRLVDFYHNSALGKSSYYLASLRKGEAWPEPGSTEVLNRMIGRQLSGILPRSTDARDFQIDISHVISVEQAMTSSTVVLSLNHFVCPSIHLPSK